MHHQSSQPIDTRSIKYSQYNFVDSNGGDGGGALNADNTESGGLHAQPWHYFKKVSNGLSSVLRHKGHLIQTSNPVKEVDPTVTETKIIGATFPTASPAPAMKSRRISTAKRARNRTPSQSGKSFVPSTPQTKTTRPQPIINHQIPHTPSHHKKRQRIDTFGLF